jgi:glutamine synthetase
MWFNEGMDATVNNLTYYLMTDLGGITRGRGLWGKEDEKPKSSVGWVPVNQVISPFDTIPPNPFGSHGDCRLFADADTLTDVQLPDGVRARFLLCDVGSLDGSSFGLCARSFLKKMVRDLESAGLRLMASFEQEFWLRLPNTGSPTPGFSYQRALRHEPFGQMLMETLEAAAIEPEMLLPEFAPEQFELTLKPSYGVTAADRAVISRELVRALAHQAGGEASFVPIMTPGGVGSGVHVHMSLWDLDGQPVLFDADGIGRLSTVGQSFCAGIVAHMDALCALTASSPVSYERLQPHRWSSAYTCMGDQNREATLRICPLVGTADEPKAAQFNIEYRAADATANPYLVLGGLLAAGLDGIAKGLPAPPLVNTDPADMSDAERESLGARRLPLSLAEALDRFEKDEVAAQWLGDELRDTYLLEKRAEISACADLSAEQICKRYSAVF